MRRELIDRVSGSAATGQLVELWRSRRAGPALRTVVGFGALYGAIEILLRNRVPPPGELVFGVLIGLLYAMVAFGLILIYRANRIINFAQAEMGASAALLAVLLIKVHHVPYVVAFLVAMAAAVISGMVVELVVVRRFARAPRLVLSVATIGLALIFAVVQFYLPKWLGGKFLVDPTPPKTPFSGVHLTIHPLTFDANSLVILAMAGLAVLGLSAFFRFTDVGIGVRAAAENADRARLLGISVNRLSTVVWILATALSTMGVFLRIPVIGLPIGADIGPYVLLYALAAAVIARMDSFGVALAAGVAIGVIEQSMYYFSHDPSIASAIMLPILLVAMLAQRSKLSRGQDSGVATWSLSKEFRPIPPELRQVPEVAWGRFGVAVIVLGLALALPYLVSLEQQILASVIVIYAIVAVSLVILTGWAGQISLGQWGLAGVGAFLTSGFALDLHADFFVTLVAAGITGALVAVVIGLPALRIQGLYLAVTTLAFGIAVQVYVLSPNYFRSVLPSGLQTINRPLLYGRYSIAGPRAYYYLCLVFLGLCLASAQGLRRSRAGRVMIAARDNERGAQSYGVSVPLARLSAFAISGFWAALAGCLFTYHQQAVQPAAFDPTISLLLILIVVIGGITSLPGAMLGALFIGVLKYGGFSAQVQSLASGVGVLFLLFVVPGGLAQVFYDSRDALLRAVAVRRGIVVPSLLADVRTESGEAAVLRSAAASVDAGTNGTNDAARKRATPAAVAGSQP